MTSERRLLLACVMCLLSFTSGAATSTVAWTPMPNWAPPRLGDFPTAADLNQDNRPDLVVAGFWHAYRNDGSCSGPLWSQSDEWLAGVPNPVYPHPELADLDGDGDADLLIGEWYGHIYLYRNVGTPQSPAWMRDDAYYYHHWSGWRAPGTGDLDEDGDLDVVSGSSYGALLVQWNDGTPASPIWRDDLTFFAEIPGTLLGLPADPNLADLDGDGDLDLVTAPEDPSVMHAFENRGPGSSPMWMPNDDLLLGVERPESAFGAALTDLDCDGRADLVVFGRWGGVGAARCYRNDGPMTGVEAVGTWTSIKALFR